MTGHVISHRSPRRKRGSFWGFALRRFGALAVTIAALIAASWIAPYLYCPAPTQPVRTAAAPAPPPKLPPPAELLKTLADADQAPAMQSRRAQRGRRGVPLDARLGEAGEDFEVLSAAELDAISQARD